MKLLSFPSNFWTHCDPEKAQHFSFIPIFQFRPIQRSLHLPGNAPLDFQDLYSLLIIFLSYATAGGLNLETKGHILQFSSFLSRLEDFPPLHNMLIYVLVNEWNAISLITTLD